MNLTQLSVLARQLAGNGFQVVRFTCKGLNLQYRVNVYKEVLVSTYYYNSNLHVVNVSRRLEETKNTLLVTNISCVTSSSFNKSFHAIICYQISGSVLLNY